MTRWVTMVSILASGCSLIVPGNEGFTPDLVDAGQTVRDGGTGDAGADPDMDAAVDGGSDAGPTCEPDLEVCGGECTDTNSDLAHCGACGNACAATDICREGACIDPVVEVAAGYGHTCARQASGKVWCWGWNGQGQLGDGTTLNRLVPTSVGKIDDAAQLAVGYGLVRAGGISVWGWTCARLSTGLVRCWGENGHGELGDASTAQRSLPVDVVGLGVVSNIEAGFPGGCGVSADHRLHCWGGVDSATGEVQPVEMVAPSGVTGGWARRGAFALFGRCVLGTTGEVYCWGSNNWGQLGDGTTNDRMAPGAVLDVPGAVGISVSSFAACALTADGAVQCWGRGDALGAGLGTMDPHPTPLPVVGITDAVAIDALGDTCAIHGPDRRVSCWGDVPVEVEGLTDVVDVAVGFDHSCAALEDGSVHCWGSNDAGQLGDGTTEDRSSPTRVLDLP